MESLSRNSGGKDWINIRKEFKTMNEIIKIFPTPFALAEALAFELVNLVKKVEKREFPFTFALSGGSTPRLLFSVLGDHFASSVKWDNTHIFWTDERCVPPDNTESNYRTAWKGFIERINIPEKNIHRIRGEDDAVKESMRYSEEIAKFTRQRNGLPVFDFIMLGLGEDGHTASIFPGNKTLFHSHRICEVTIHPVTDLKRITLTGSVINNAELITFLVTGKKKAEIIGEILGEKESAKRFPASHIAPADGKLLWYLDRDAATNI